jgi:iron complex transport system permease protein
LLQADNVSFAYLTAPVVRGVTLDVPADGFVGLLGPNGSGKTTMLRLLAGTRQPQRGEVRLDGVPIARLGRTALARRMAVVPQETHLAFEYRVIEVALMGRYAHLRALEIEGPPDVAIAREALAATGTLHLAERPFATLSGGEKQRVIIAAALAQLSQREAAAAAARGILLLDEPTASLDLKYQLEIAALLRTLHRERGVAIVLSTHDLAFAAGLCRTLVLLRDGVVRASGATEEVLTPSAVADLYQIPLETAQNLHRRVYGDTQTGQSSAPRSRLTVPFECPGPLRFARTLTGFAALAIVAVILAPLVGSTTISLRRVFDWTTPFARNTEAQIFFIARLPRTLAGAFVGATLAAAGVVFQGLLRNPLATPFTLGISAGAALGAMLAITFNWSVGALGVSAVPVSSLAGSLAAVGIVYALAQARHRGLSTTVLLLAGVTLNAFLSALILFVQYFANFADIYRSLRWLMGDLDVSSYDPIVAALPLALAAFAVFAWIARPLNLLSLGPDSAEAHGLDVTRTHRAAFLSASLATGAAVSVGGPIGFIGIIIPHLVRLLVGADHRIVLPASALFGAAFLIACDVLSRTIIAPVVLPVGIITALIGGPFFLWLLIRNR